jgi:hypothetical protein
MLAGSYTVRVYNSAGCWAESPPEFHGGGPAISTIALGCADSLYYNPGDRIHMPILLTASQNLTQNGVARYTAHLRYLRNVLMAADSVVYDVRDSGPERSIALDGLRRGNIESGELGGIDFIAMLGDTLCTHVTLDSLVWEDRAVTVSFVGQECELCVRTCSEGGTRLFSSEGKFQLRQNRPNPFNGGTEIEFTMIERGPARLSVLDLFGRTLAVPFEGDREPGAYTVRFDAAGLPSGTYMYLLQSRSLSWSRLMQIVK